MENTTSIKSERDGWKVFLGFVCVVILVFGVFYSKNPSNNLSYLIGYSLGQALFIWGVFYAIFLRGVGGKSSSISFWAIFISLIIGSLIAASKYEQQAKGFVDDLQSQISQLEKLSVDSEGMPRQIKGTIDTTPTVPGELGVIQGFIKKNISDMVSLRNNYLLELEAIGWNGILDANRIKEDSDFIESKFIIKRAKEVVGKYHKKNRILLDGIKENVNTLNIKKSSKDAMLKGVNKTLPENKNRTERMWELEGEVIREFDHIITLLSSTKGAWQVDGGQILFNEDVNLKDYNSRLTKINEILVKQEEIQQQSSIQVNNSLEKMK